MSGCHKNPCDHVGQPEAWATCPHYKRDDAPSTTKEPHRVLLTGVDNLVRGSGLSPADQLAVLALASVLAIRRVLGTHGISDRGSRVRLLRAIEADWAKVIRRHIMDQGLG